jgi:hypothetical protein
LLMSFEDLCRKSFLMLAIFACNLVTRRLGFFQLLENFFFRAVRPCNLSYSKLSLGHGGGLALTFSPTGHMNSEERM